MNIKVKNKSKTEQVPVTIVPSLESIVETLRELPVDYYNRVVKAAKKVRRSDLKFDSAMKELKR